MARIKIKEDPTLVKDTGSGAIINTDKDSLRAYKARKQAAAREKTNTDRIDKLEREVLELKSLISKLMK